MKNLFLTASFADVAQYFEQFIGYPTIGKTVTFIITASIPEEYTGYVDNDKSAFEALGVYVDVFDVTEKNEVEITEKLAKNEFIYVSGGNTFYLLQELKKSKADQFITAQITAGKTYIGASAGSMILSHDLTYVEQIDDKNKAPELKDNTGLGLIPFYVLPHYKNEPFTAIMDTVFLQYQAQLTFVPISNTQAIEIKGDKHQVIGIPAASISE
ncbi:Type 1 glutamine amidotransferase-like domain-containing protein [Sphingobacterium sp. MYb382]|uniref:Type 1 glutamine amidotransferase-like domain-containing protein n=1 Tax=Sphingobacterium sp. MYb382 TaxID=2745278 RepID=UPI0030B66093